MYDTTELQQLLLVNRIEKLTLERVVPDDEGEKPLVLQSKTLETFTTGAEEFGILVQLLLICDNMTRHHILQ